MIQTIESSTDTSITIGQNGLIVLKSESGSNLDKIIKVFKMLDSTTDDSNMDEKIQKILDENN
jgi:exosome complex RNA-binding protein Rrp4